MWVQRRTRPSWGCWQGWIPMPRDQYVPPWIKANFWRPVVPLYLTVTMVWLKALELRGDGRRQNPELLNKWLTETNLNWVRLKISSVRENKVTILCTAHFAVWDLYFLAYKEIKLVYLCNQYSVSEGQRKISKIVLRNNIIIELSIWLPKGITF